MRAVLVALVVALLNVPIARAEVVPANGDAGSDPVLLRMVQEELTGAGGATFGVAVRHLPSGRTAFVNPDLVLEPASLFKLAVMYEAYRQIARGRLSLDESVTIAEAHLDPELGESVVAPGDSLTVDEALDLMITVSETPPALALLDRMGYQDLAADLHELGLEQTTIDHGTTVTARDLMRFFEALARLEAVDDASSRAMLGRLLRQRVRDRIPRLLPPDTPVANKTGNLPGVVNDAGLVYSPAGPIVIVLLAQDVEDDDAVRSGMALLSRALVVYAEGGGFGPPPATSALWDPRSTPACGAVGAPAAVAPRPGEAQCR